MELVRRSWARAQPFSQALGGRLISAAGVMVLNILVSRQLPLVEAGRFFAAYILVMGLAIILQCGLNLLVIRNAAPLRHDTSARFQLVGRMLATVGVVALLASGLAGLWGVIRGAEGPMGYLWLLIPPVTIMGVLAAAFKAEGRAGWGGFWENGIISAIAAVALILIPQSDALDTWRVLCGAGWAACVIGCVHLFWGQDFKGLQWREMLPSFRLIGEARFLGAIAILSYLAQWGGVLLSSVLMNDESVAILNAMFRLLAPLQFVILTLDAFLAPKFATAERQEIIRLRQLGIWAGLAMGLPYVLLILVIPDAVMTTLFGKAYEGYGPELAILMLGTALQLAMGPNGVLLNMKGQDRRVLSAVVARVCCYFVGVMLLTSEAAMMGVVVSFVVATLVGSFANWYYARRIVNNWG